MYKCTDCDKTYEIKPDYCECGNNVFEQIPSDSECKNIKEYVPLKKSFAEQYPKAKRFLDSLDVVSVVIFVICLILSLAAIVFINPKASDTQPKEHKTIKQTADNIPDIEKIWNSASSSPEKIQPASKPVETIPVEVKKNDIIDTRSSKTQSGKKTPSNAVQNTSSTVKKNTSQAKPPQSAKSTQNPPSQKVKPKQDDTEWYNYRVALRQALFHNLAVTSVNGSGKCGIEFSIDKNGKFLNRAFTFQSDNDSVNDAVYKMMMKMPGYYPPPSSYNGGKVKMIFAFDNGSYYINYIN